MTAVTNATTYLQVALYGWKFCVSNTTCVATKGSSFAMPTGRASTMRQLDARDAGPTSATHRRCVHLQLAQAERRVPVLHKPVAVCIQQATLAQTTDCMVPRPMPPRTACSST